ncbi:hypothetical protein G7Z17_g7854 [Cylindrodendrum hubeiense]|uniref:Ketoreductase domain-containing protein n=1 Tax=Cylindrodendrum hubeiense TaxID=595255 RepID=A0A9P5LDS5_9HYPO|nr:hypothetical protein G7Z17_g7854 [Cylindrodendrum hubeiense]
MRTAAPLSSSSSRHALRMPLRLERDKARRLAAAIGAPTGVGLAHDRLVRFGECGCGYSCAAALSRVIVGGALQYSVTGGRRTRLHIVGSRLVCKLALVTGASRGIGLAITKTLAARGANLLLAYTSDSSAASTATLAAELASKHSIKVIPVKADLSTVAGPDSLIAQATAAFSPLRIDILVNNAGVAYNDNVTDINPDDFHRTYDINVLGPLLLVKAVVPFLPTDRSGRIINLSSVSSSMGFVGQSVYGGSKAALEAMTRTWARELSERCTVNAVNPGPVRSEMYSRNSDEFKKLIKPFIQNAPLMAAREGIDPPEVVEDAKTSGGRAGEAEEVAGIVAMLAGPDSAWCTGQVICANGGMIFGMQ